MFSATDYHAVPVPWGGSSSSNSHYSAETSYVDDVIASISEDEYYSCPTRSSVLG